MLHYHRRPPFTFMGVPNSFWNVAQVAVLPVPYDGTASYQSGTRFGPEAIISASRQVELFDIHYGLDVSQKINLYTLDEVEPCVDSPRKMIDRVAEAMGDIVSAKKFPLLLGGEHSITLGAIEATVQHFKKVSILQLDAHSDFRDEFDGSKYNHACVMRRCADLAPVTAVGIRNVSSEDRQTVKKSRLNTFYAPSVPTDKIIQSLTDQVYITIDIDVFDSGIMPATGTPEPGGLDWYAVTNLIREVAKRKQIVGADIVELMPIGGLRAPDFLAAKLGYQLIADKFFAKRFDPRRRRVAKD